MSIANRSKQLPMSFPSLGTHTTHQSKHCDVLWNLPLFVRRLQVSRSFIRVSREAMMTTIYVRKENELSSSFKCYSIWQWMKPELTKVWYQRVFFLRLKVNLARLFCNVLFVVDTGWIWTVLPTDLSESVHQHAVSTTLTPTIPYHRWMKQRKLPLHKTKPISLKSFRYNTCSSAIKWSRRVRCCLMLLSDRRAACWHCGSSPHRCRKIVLRPKTA
jgi:hypothetical protein